MAVLTETGQRRVEVERCKDVIGWSWLKLGERLDLTPSQALAIKSGKRPIADSDLDWLQALAEAVDALPRPGPSDSVVAPPAAMVRQGVAAMPGAAVAATTWGDVAVLPGPEELSEVMTLDAAASIVAGMYLGLENAGLTADQREGAQWAIGELAQQFGVTDRVMAQIRRRPAVNVAAPVAMPAVAAQAHQMGAIGRVPL